MSEGTLTLEEARKELGAVITALDYADAPGRDAGVLEQHMRITALYQRERATEHVCMTYVKLHLAAHERAQALAEALEGLEKIVSLVQFNMYDGLGWLRGPVFDAQVKARAALAKAKEAAAS